MVGQGIERKTGTFYWVYMLQTKGKKLNRVFTRNFKTKEKAIDHAKNKVKQGKWLQGELMFTKNILTDVDTGIGLDTRGVITQQIGHGKDTKWKLLWDGRKKLKKVM